jgi:hypothetical protein
MALTDNIISYWKMDEAAGNLQDETNAHDATYNGALYSQTGKINTSIGFDGDNDYANVGHLSEIEDGDDFTVSAWIRGHAWDDGVRCTFFSGDIAGNNRSVTIRVDPADSKVEMYVWNTLNVGHTIKGGTALTANGATWYHVVGTYDGSNLKLYVNGSSDAVAVAHTGNLDDITGDYRIGSCGDGSQFFHGEIDEVGLWDRAITSAEVTSLYNSGAGWAYPFSTGPDFTKMQINIADTWKAGAGMQINIADTWKQAAGMQVNIGDAWKTVF